MNGERSPLRITMKRLTPSLNVNGEAFLKQEDIHLVDEEEFVPETFEPVDAPEESKAEEQNAEKPAEAETESGQTV